MMNRTIKKKWINALRSGRFKQGNGCLRSGEGHCCLGVLCEITGNGKNRDMTNSYPVDSDPLGANESTVGNFMGLSVKTQFTLARLNDYGHTFEEIANYISKNVKAVD
jgi:hypothetical protein